MFSKNKKAISPLLATVLLVAFIIIIAVLVWLWWGNVVKEASEKTSVKTQGQFACQNEVEFIVKDISCTYIDPNTAIINIENKGSSRIDNFKAIVTDSSGDLSVIPNLDESIFPAEAKQISVTHNLTTPSKITLIPMVAREGFLTVCNEKQIIQNC